MSDLDIVATSIPKRVFVENVLEVTLNREKRPSVALKAGMPGLKKMSEYSYIHSVGGKMVTKFVTIEQVNEWLTSAKPHDAIVMFHHTRFCKNCKRPSTYFIDDERRGHSTCRGCGVVHRLVQNKFSLRLSDDGTPNKSQWECTPGMTARDCSITTRKGRTIGKKPPSHLRNYWRINAKVDGVAHPWHFLAIEGLIRSGKRKLKKLYYIIHNDSEFDDDASVKLPHGGAALAAACFYCAVLEFESRVGYKTPCTLPAIQESAQQCRDKKSGRRCRDVTDAKILKYSKMLRRNGLCGVQIPSIGAETLQFHPKSASLEHARMAIFSECQPVRFHLPSKERWGIRVVDTNQGVLKIDSCLPEQIAWQRGLRKGDYIFQLDRDTLDVFCTAKKLEGIIGRKKAGKPAKPVIEITIMRKKKN